MRTPFLSALALGGGLLTVSAADKKFSVTVQAGEFERRHTVVEFQLPPGAESFQQVRDAKGRLAPLQVDKSGRANFVVAQLDKGAQAGYELTSAHSDIQWASEVRVTRDGTKLHVGLPGHPLLAYQAEAGEFPRENIKSAFKRGGYIEPILTFSGKRITDDFPPNHIHHHGVWWAWTKTEFDGRAPDFWNMGESKGRVEFVSLGQTWSGPVHGGFGARHRFVDLTATEPAAALHENWEVRVFNQEAAAAFWIFDLVSTQECATDKPLKLPEYYYGGLGFRGNWGWNGKDKCRFLTSEGETDRVKGNSTRGRWCDISGEVDGAAVGIAVLGHPGNFRAPQPMRLHPGEPFFCYAPQQLGDTEIAPGQPYISRYRFVVHDGPPDKALLERLWNDYAHPPVVSVK